jgi:hypothetical protein
MFAVPLVSTTKLILCFVVPFVCFSTIIAQSGVYFPAGVSIAYQSGSLMNNLTLESLSNSCVKSFSIPLIPFSLGPVSIINPSLFFLSNYFVI